MNRRASSLANAVIATIASLAVAGFGADLAARHALRWDLSADGAATLLPETLGVLQAADQAGLDVTITGFSSQARDAESEVKDRYVQDLLRELEARSPRVRTRFVAFDRERQVAEDKGVDRYGTVLVEAGGDRVDVIDRELFRTHGPKADRRVEFTGEAAIARAIAQVVTHEPRKAYFLVGHGEQRRDGTLAPYTALLTAQGWDTADLDLLRGQPSSAGTTAPPTVPDDATVVLIVGPDAPLTAEEDAALEAWLRRGGRVGYFVDPGGFVASFVESYGVYVQGGTVQDERRYAPHDDRPVLGALPHAITQTVLDRDTPVVFAGTAPLEVLRRSDATTVDLVVTSRQGWIERGHEQPPVHDPADGEGPGIAATAVEVPLAERPATRLVVVGDTDVLRQELIGEAPGNASFAVNVARWLAGDDDRAGPVGRASPVRVVAMTDDDLRRVGFFVVGVWPTCFLLLAVLVERTRRARSSEAAS